MNPIVPPYPDTHCRRCLVEWRGKELPCWLCGDAGDKGLLPMRSTYGGVEWQGTERETA